MVNRLFGSTGMSQVIRLLRQGLRMWRRRNGHTGQRLPQEIDRCRRGIRTQRLKVLPDPERQGTEVVPANTTGISTWALESLLSLTATPITLERWLTSNAET